MAGIFDFLVFPFIFLILIVFILAERKAAGSWHTRSRCTYAPLQGGIQAVLDFLKLLFSADFLGDRVLEANNKALMISCIFMVGIKLLMLWICFSFLSINIPCLSLF